MGALWVPSFFVGSFMWLAGYHVITHDSFVTHLYDLVSRAQVTHDQPYRTFRSWYQSKGNYPSHVMLNFHGDFLQTMARRLVRIYDNNMFTTAWVTLSLLEAHVHGGAPRPSDEQLVLSINALREYQDKNQHHHSSIMTFWKQEFNQSVSYWQCRPVNLVDSFQLVNILPLHWIERFLTVIGLKELAKFFEFVSEEESMFLTAFRVPPDFDDTFVNLALGSLLYQEKDEFTVGWRLWESHNTNLTSVFNALKKYAYRPFSSDPDVNSIDPRTYFHIRGFLDRAKANGQDVALVPTWVQNIGEERREFELGVGMPFMINNVDVSAAANTLHGTTSGILSGLLSPDVLRDPGTEIYHNTSALVAYEIMNNFSGRPDLALTYYPSVMEFYWFVTETVSVMETYRRQRSLPLKVMETVYTMLRDVAEKYITKNILEKAERQEKDRVYFDDFLGNGDTTLAGKPLKRAEDRIFTTAMAANALMSAWSYYDTSSRSSHWKEGTPGIVQSTVSGCVNWLRDHSIERGFQPWNAFFSGSAKSAETLPFWYPGNRLEYLNGTAISDWSQLPDSEFVYAVQGYIPEQQYNAMLRDTHFGFPTPMNFSGYNNGSSFFPFWSSTAHTYSTTLLAVSRYESLRL